MLEIVKGIIFDMDGLMFDTEKLLTKFWCEAANFYGYPMTPQHVLGIRSLASKYAIPHLKGLFGESFDYYAVRSKRISLMNDYIEKNGIEKKKGLDELLSFLSSTKLKIAVATATDKQRTTMYLSKAGIFDCFDEIITGDMIENGKPAPDIYLCAAKKLGLDTKYCVALEDSPNGIRSAYDAGCMPVMIPDLSQPDDDIKPMLYGNFNNLSDFSDYLRVLLAKTNAFL